MKLLHLPHSSRKISLIALGLMPFILTACGGDNDSSTPTSEFSITVTNASHNQPLSPVAVILHTSNYRAWSTGSAASIGLEDLAESGSPSRFIEEADDALASTSADGITSPGESTRLELSSINSNELELTIASMLVNTNDAFAGATGLAIGHLEVGETLRLLAPVYDAGTETNSETVETIPGPAANGEGFNTARETRNQVTRHPGVVTQADGYADSALDQSHRFDNGAIIVHVERIL